VDQPVNRRMDVPQRPGDGEEVIKSGSLPAHPPAAGAENSARGGPLFGQSASLGYALGGARHKALAERPGLASSGSSLDHISDEIVVLKEPLSPRAADVRRLAQKLAVHWFRGEDAGSALSIISAERGEGRTTLAANLACVYAQAGVRTLLIDADLSHPQIHGLFGADLTEHDEGGSLLVSGVENLALISASRLFDLEYGRVMPTALSALIDSQGAGFDVILVDTTAASVSDDYLFAGLSTGGAIVVTREGKSKVKAAAKMLNSCEDAGVKIVGGIMLNS